MPETTQPRRLQVDRGRAAPTAAHTVRRQLESLRGVADGLRQKEDLKRRTALQLAEHAALTLGHRDAVALSVQQVFRTPLAAFAARVETLKQQISHLDGLLALRDHELDDLGRTRQQLPVRMGEVKAKLDFDQELLLWHGRGRGRPEAFFSDPALAARAAADRRGAKEVGAEVFAARQELVRLRNAAAGIDGAKAFARA